MNNELNFPPNFERLVLGRIDADFASKYSWERLQLLTRSIRYTLLCTSPTSTIQQHFVKHVGVFNIRNAKAFAFL